MKTWKCDNCGKAIEYPALIGVSATVRLRVGHATPMGYEETKMDSRDFCDVGCMDAWLAEQHRRKHPQSHVSPWDSSR